MEWSLELAFSQGKSRAQLGPTGYTGTGTTAGPKMKPAIRPKKCPQPGVHRQLVDARPCSDSGPGSKPRFKDRKEAQNPCRKLQTPSHTMAFTTWRVIAHTGK